MGKAIVSRFLDGGAKVVTSAREMTTDHENREHIFIQADLSTSDGCTKVVNGTLLADPSAAVLALRDSKG